MIAPSFSGRCFGWPTSSKVIRANGRASYGSQKGGKRSKRTRQTHKLARRSDGSRSETARDNRRKTVAASWLRFACVDARSSPLHLQIHQLGMWHHVRIQVGHDHERSGEDQEYDEHAERERQNIVAAVRSGRDVKKE